MDEKTPGVIVFLWLFIFVEHYFLFKFPRFTIVVTITIVTQACPLSTCPGLCSTFQLTK